MNDAFRGMVLMVSVVLWLPVLRPLLAGEMTTAEAGLRYAAALLLAWGGGVVLSAIVRSYSSESVSEADRDLDDQHPRRRREDATD